MDVCYTAWFVREHDRKSYVLQRRLKFLDTLVVLFSLTLALIYQSCMGIAAD